MATHHIFCDESHIDSHAYRVQGGIWVPDDGMRAVRSAFRELRERHPKAPELKWVNVTGRQPFKWHYDLIDLFFKGAAARFLTFQCIVIASADDPSRPLDKVGRDEGFYKAYYTLLRHRLKPGGEYHIRLDQKPSPRPEPEEELADCLNAAALKESNGAKVLSCKGICSKSDDLLQLADVLCGCLGWAWNGRQSTCAAKPMLEARIAEALGWPHLKDRETGRDAVKFNVWRYRPKRK